MRPNDRPTCPKCAGWTPQPSPAPISEAELRVAFLPAMFTCVTHGDWCTLYNGRVAFCSDPGVQYGP